MRGVNNRVNPVWGESAVTCNTLETRYIPLVLAAFALGESERFKRTLSARNG